MSENVSENFKDYIILDIETTGLSKFYHKITEIAAIKYKNHKPVEEFNTLINPEVKIPSFITKLTGIDDEMVKNEKKISEILPDFHNFIEDLPIIAHNASFDYGFLNYNSEKHLGKSLENPKLCTVKLARRLYPDLPSRKLSFLCEMFEIENKDAHRAMSDTKATATLFSHFHNELFSRGIIRKEDVIKFEKTSPKKINEFIKKINSK